MKGESSEERLRDALRELIDFGLCGIDELRYNAYEKAETLWNESINQGTDLERLRERIAGRHRQVGFELGLTDDVVEYQDGLIDAYDEIMGYIADEFGVGGKDADKNA